jgi:hypothetical protein
MWTILCLPEGTVSLAAADSRLVPGIATQGERKMCSCARVLGLRSSTHGFSQEKLDCADASSSKDSPNRKTCCQVIAGRWERSHGKQGMCFCLGDLNWTLFAFFFFSNECMCFNILGLRRRWQIPFLFCPKSPDMAYR